MIQPGDKVQYIPRDDMEFAQPGVVREVVGGKALMDWAITAPSWVPLGWLEPRQYHEMTWRMRDAGGNWRYVTEMR